MLSCYPDHFPLPLSLPLPPADSSNHRCSTCTITALPPSFSSTTGHGRGRRTGGRRNLPRLRSVVLTRSPLLLSPFAFVPSFFLVRILAVGGAEIGLLDHRCPDSDGARHALSLSCSARGLRITYRLGRHLVPREREGCYFFPFQVELLNDQESKNE